MEKYYIRFQFSDTGVRYMSFQFVERCSEVLWHKDIELAEHMSEEKKDMCLDFIRNRKTDRPGTRRGEVNVYRVSDNQLMESFLV